MAANRPRFLLGLKAAFALAATAQSMGVNANQAPEQGTQVVSVEAMERHYEAHPAGSKIDIIAFNTDYVGEAVMAIEGVKTATQIEAYVLAKSGITDAAAANEIAKNVDFFLIRNTNLLGTVPIAIAPTGSPLAYGHRTPSQPTVQCIVNPLLPEGIAFPMTGLSRAQTVNFANRHEFTHCHTEYIMSGNTERLHEEQKASKKPNVQIIVELTRLHLNSEVMADVSAAADMIALDGQSPDIINTIADWRQQNLYTLQVDIGHYSSPALRALHGEIAKMGLPAFRQMTDQQRYDLATNITNANILPANVVAAINFHFAIENHKKIATKDNPLLKKIEKVIKQNRRLLNGITMSSSERRTFRHMIDHITQNRNTNASISSIHVPLSFEQASELDAWNIQAQLVNASEVEGDTLLSRDRLNTARLAVLHSLREEIRQTPDNPLLVAKVIKLDNAVAAIVADYYFTKEHGWPEPFTRPATPTPSIPHTS